MSTPNPWESHIEQPANALVANTAATKPIAKRSSSDINLLRLISLWPWVLLSTALMFIVAKLYLRYQVPVYMASIMVNMAEDNTRMPFGTTSLFDTRNPMNDKIDILKAPTTSKLLVDTLGLWKKAIRKGRFKDQDLYGTFTWNYWGPGYDPDRVFAFSIFPQKDGNGFTWKMDGKSGNGKMGVPFVMGRDSFVVYALGRFDADDEILCQALGSWNTAFKTAGKIWVGPGRDGNSATITFPDILRNRAEHVLNALIDAYNTVTIEHKSKGLKQSITFMNERIAPLGGELDSIETAMARYKSSQSIVGTSSPGELYLGNMAALDQQAAQIRLQRQTLDAVENFINNPSTQEENVALVGINDGYLQSLIAQYQELRIEKERLATVATPQNETRRRVEEQFENTRANISTQLNNYRKTINLAQANIAGQMGKAQSIVRSTPAAEKNLLERQRQQNIKETLYLLLLQQREEASIALSSTTSDLRILAPARAGNNVISPKYLTIYGGAIGIGVLLPLLIGLGREVLNNKVTSKKQLEDMVSAPVLASIDLADLGEGEEFALVSDNDRSITAEQFRGLRAALDFYRHEGKAFTILITSSYSGEGKTFISANIARSYALLGKKVALLEFDMRKPKLARRLGISVEKGLSTMLLGTHKPNEVWLPDPSSPNLHLYPTAIIPPNPSELMNSVHNAAFREYLLNNYDVIVIDTPPIGLVADAQLLGKWADVSLVVVRFGVTPKDQLVEIESWNQMKRLPNIGTILNGVKTTGYYGYSYSPYYYRNKYGYEYYTTGSGNKGKKKRKSIKK